MKQTAEWPNSSIPEWLHDIALNPQDYHGDFYLQGTAAAVAGWVSWEKGAAAINLDGDFTIQQLREIVAMMEANAP